MTDRDEEKATRWGRPPKTSARLCELTFVAHATPYARSSLAHHRIHGLTLGDSMVAKASARHLLKHADTNTDVQGQDTLLISAALYACRQAALRTLNDYFSSSSFDHPLQGRIHPLGYYVSH